MRQAIAFAPATVANLAVGFDLLGHSLEGVGDCATVRRTDDGRVRIVAVGGCVDALPLEASRNTAGKALLGICGRVPGLGFELELDKGIPLGSGMGGSAASAVAALVAANALLDQPLGIEALYQLALDGEEVASGGRHGDNVAPCLLGGLTLAPQQGAPVSLPVPAGLCYAVVHPDLVLRTRDARLVLQGDYALEELVRQSEGLALVLTGLHQADVSLLRRGMRDVLIEPRRQRLIPRFAEVKRAALDCGAIGASIAGAGPSVFGWFTDRASADRAAQAMRAAFADGGLSSDAHVGAVAGPAARVESCSA